MLTRNRYFATVMPIYAVLYVIGLVAFDHNSKFATIGALGFALIAIVGAMWIRPAEGAGRQRNRNRNRGGKSL